MTTLNATARQELRDHGISPTAWARRWYTDGKWHGDACGCPDDRCISFHHDGPDDCLCLTALLSEPVEPERFDMSGSTPGVER